MRCIIVFILVFGSVMVSGQRQLFCHASQKVFSAVEPDGPASCLADNYWFWNLGKVVKIKFLSGSEKIKQRIIKVAKQWEEYGRLSFSFTDVGESEVRINLDDKGYFDAAIGWQSNLFSQDEATVQIDTTLFNNDQNLGAAVLHTFGHILGFQHENIVPFGGRQWHEKEINNYFSKFGWDANKVKEKIIIPYSASYSNSITADPFSVMNIIFPSEWICEARHHLNSTLSNEDKKMMRLLYPYESDKQIELASVYVTDFRKVRTEKTISGVTFYPEFSLGVKNTSRLSFSMQVLDENGDIIQNVIEEPVFPSVVYLNPDSKIYNINQASNDIGFFISNESILLKYQEKGVKLVFKVYYSNSEGEVKLGYSSTPYDFIWNQ